MSYRLTAAAIEYPGLKPMERLLLISVAHHANEKTGLCCPSMDRIALMLGLSTRQTRRLMQQVLKLGILARCNRYNKTPTYGFSEEFTADFKYAPVRIRTQSVHLTEKDHNKKELDRLSMRETYACVHTGAREAQL